MKRIIYLFLFIALFIGCSSKRMRGTEAKTVAGSATESLKVTADVAEDLSLEQYALVDVYLRNLNSDWLRVKNIEIVNVDGVERFRVMLGQDLKTWRKSVALDSDLRVEEAKTAVERARFKARRARLDEYSDEDHLYQPFSIPSQLQTRKWILFQFDNKKAVKSFKFEVTWIDDRRQTFEVLVQKGAQ